MTKANGAGSKRNPIQNELFLSHLFTYRNSLFRLLTQPHLEKGDRANGALAQARVSGRQVEHDALGLPDLSRGGLSLGVVAAAD